MNSEDSLVVDGCQYPKSRLKKQIIVFVLKN